MTVVKGNKFVFSDEFRFYLTIHSGAYVSGTKKKGHIKTRVVVWGAIMAIGHF